MDLKLTRKRITSKGTFGELAVDGQFECFTLEPSPEQGKGPIPAWTYPLVVDFSERFQRQMPHILNVPGFTGVRIHSGNTEKNTEGCCLIGQLQNIDEGWIGASHDAFNRLFTKIDNNQPKVITIVGP